MNDVLLDTTGDLTIKNGDISVGDATVQNQQYLVLCNKGEFKEHPEVGVGIVDVLLDEEPRKILQTIKRQFEYDGMTVDRLRFRENGTIQAQAYYN